MPKPSYSFHAKERLKSRKVIDNLFHESQSKVIFPFRIVWKVTELPSSFPAQIAISIPKRIVPKAAHRNRIKRQVKEAYRLNKHLLYQSISETQTNSNTTQYVPKKQIAIMLIYISRKNLSYPFIYAKLVNCLKYLIKKEQVIKK